MEQIVVVVVTDVGSGDGDDDVIAVALNERPAAHVRGGQLQGAAVVDVVAINIAGDLGGAQEVTHNCVYSCQQKNMKYTV